MTHDEKFSRDATLVIYGVAILVIIVLSAGEARRGRGVEARVDAIDERTCVACDGKGRVELVSYESASTTMIKEEACKTCSGTGVRPRSGGALRRYQAPLQWRCASSELGK